MLKACILESVFQSFSSWYFQRQEESDCKIDDFDGTENGKSSEKSHGAANETELTLRGEFDPPQDLVVCVGVKIDLNQLKRGIFQFNGRYVLSWLVQESLSRVEDEILHKLPFEVLVLFQQLNKRFLIISIFCCNICQRFVDQLNVSMETFTARNTVEQVTGGFPEAIIAPWKTEFKTLGGKWIWELWKFNI